MADNALNRDDLQIINNSMQAIKDAEEQIKRAEQAGFDMTDRKAKLALQNQQLLDIKRAFFPRSKA